MSTDLIQLNDMMVNSFYGGIKRGACLQFTPMTSEKYSVLIRAEVVELRDALNVWLDEPEIENLRAQLAAAQQETRDALAVAASWKRAVEGLTPGGSEFANDPERCAQFIKDRCNYPKQIIELRKQLAAALRTGEREG